MCLAVVMLCPVPLPLTCLPMATVVDILNHPILLIHLRLPILQAPPLILMGHSHPIRLRPLILAIPNTPPRRTMDIHSSNQIRIVILRATLCHRARSILECMLHPLQCLQLRPHSILVCIHHPLPCLQLRPLSLSRLHTQSILTALQSTLTFIKASRPLPQVLRSRRPTHRHLPHHSQKNLPVSYYQ